MFIYNNVYCLYVCVFLFCYFSWSPKLALYCSKYSHLLSRSFQIHKSCVCGCQNFCCETHTYMKLNDWNIKWAWCAFFHYQYFLRQSYQFSFNNVFQELIPFYDLRLVYYMCLLIWYVNMIFIRLTKIFVWL